MRKINYTIIFLILFLINGCAKIGETNKELLIDKNVKDLKNDLSLVTTKLATVPDSYSDFSFITFSPNGRHVAYIAFEADKVFVVINNKGSKAYDEAPHSYSDPEPIFSPDGQKIAYIISKKFEDKDIDEDNIIMFVVIGDKEGKPYEEIASDVIFSPNGQNFAYIASHGEKSFIVVNEKEGKPYDYIEGYSITFSPNSEKIAYVARKDFADLARVKLEDISKYIKNFVVVDDTEFKYYDDVKSLIFSTDSNRIAYIAKQEGKEIVVVDEEEGKPYDNILELIFSPDSKKIAFIASTDNKDKYFIVVDGKEIKISDNYISKLAFNPDSKKMAYILKQDSKFLIVNGDEQSDTYDDITSFIFSPDGKSIAYVAHKYLEGNRREFFVMNNNIKSKSNYGSVTPGRHGPIYDGEIQSLVYSNDGKHLAYILTLEEGKEHVVVDDKEFGPYEEVDHESILFSPDSKKIAYGAQLGNELWWIVEPVK